MSITGFIVVGDRTSHGGTVLSGDQLWTIDGAAVARVGDKASCPRCKRVVTIVTSKDPSFTSGGPPAAFDGDMTDCGATLYSRHNSHSGLEKMTGEPATVKDIEDHVAPTIQKFRQHFILRDLTTDQPIADMPYTLRAQDGQVVKGYTDARGRTDVLWTDAATQVEVVAHPESRHDTDPYHYGENMDYRGL